MISPEEVRKGTIRYHTIPYHTCRKRYAQKKDIEKVLIVIYSVPVSLLRESERERAVSGKRKTQDCRE